jgi:hypothetical protein
MRKLTFLFGIFLLSCTSLHEEDTIKKIDLQIEFGGKELTGLSHYITQNGDFYARRGLYNIGDTVKFTK